MIRESDTPTTTYAAFAKILFNSSHLSNTAFRSFFLNRGRLVESCEAQKSQYIPNYPHKIKQNFSHYFKKTKMTNFLEYFSILPQPRPQRVKRSTSSGHFDRSYTWFIFDFLWLLVARKLKVVKNLASIKPQTSVRLSTALPTMA